MVRLRPRGQLTRFGYRLGLGEGSSPLAWTTDIADTKLYAALALGKLSMYMRINDTVVNAVIERKLVDVDVVEDLRSSPVQRQLWYRVGSAGGPTAGPSFVLT